jgi:hypothetical protein
MPFLNKSNALRAYATMMNTLDASHFVPLLAENFHYASQWVFEELTSKQDYLNYIEPKLRAIAKSGELPYVEMAECPVMAYTNSLGPCAVLAQGSKTNLLATVFVKVKDGYIKRLDICLIPHTSVAIRSGVYPGCKIIQLFPPYRSNDEHPR